MQRPTADELLTVLDVLAWAREQSDGVDVRASIMEAAKAVTALTPRPAPQSITFETATTENEGADVT